MISFALVFAKNKLVANNVGQMDLFKTDLTIRYLSNFVTELNFLCSNLLVTFAFLCSPMY